MKKKLRGFWGCTDRAWIEQVTDRLSLKGSSEGGMRLLTSRRHILVSVIPTSCHYLRIYWAFYGLWKLIELDPHSQDCKDNSMKRVIDLALPVCKLDQFR